MFHDILDRWYQQLALAVGDDIHVVGASIQDLCECPQRCASRVLDFEALELVSEVLVWAEWSKFLLRDLQKQTAQAVGVFAADYPAEADEHRSLVGTERANGQVTIAGAEASADDEAVWCIAEGVNLHFAVEAVRPADVPNGDVALAGFGAG